MHYYASMMCCFLIAFYALSGFIAIHAEWLLEDTDSTLYTDIRERDNTSDARTFCRNLIAPDASVHTVPNDADEQWYIVQSSGNAPQAAERQAIRCVVTESDVEVFPLRYLPIDAITDEQQYAAIQKITGGELSHHHNDPAYQLNTCDIDSVWFHAQAMIFSDYKLYEMSAEPAALIRSISDLHRGKHSDFWQTLIADVTAILLLFVVISGCIIGIHMKKKRTLGACALTFSLLLTIALLIGR